MTDLTIEATDWTEECRQGRADAEILLNQARATATPLQLVRAIREIETLPRSTGYKVGWATALALAAMR